MSLVGTRPPTVDEYEQYELGHRKTQYPDVRDLEVHVRKSEIPLRY